MYVLSTSKLKTMVGKLSKCGSNKLLEITRYYHVELTKSGMSITATDGNNYIQVKDGTMKGELDVIVKADQFSRLIDKSAVEKLKVTLHDNYLQVVGSGTYKVEIVTGEQYPTFEKPEGETKEVNVTELKRVADVNKYAISKNITEGVLNGYLFKAAKAITADGVKVCIGEIDFLSADILLTKEMMELICGVEEEVATVIYGDTKVYIETPTSIICGAEFEGVNEYPDITGLLGIEYPSVCTVAKATILGVLDRLNLFIDPFRKNEVSLAFTKQGLEISTPSGSFEVLPFSTSKQIAEFSCTVNGAFLKELVSAVQGENVEIQYGVDTLVKLVDNKTIQLLATGDDEEGAE